MMFDPTREKNDSPFRKLFLEWFAFNGGCEETSGGTGVKDDVDDDQDEKVSDVSIRR